MLCQEITCPYFPTGSTSRSSTSSHPLPLSLPNVPEHHMDLRSLDTVIQRYFTAGLMPVIHKTYLSAEKRYVDFYGSLSIVPLPTSESTICYLVACLGQQGLAHTTIKTYLSGVRQLQIAHGFKDPCIDQMPRLRQILKGVKVECGKQGKASHSRLPITPSIHRKLKSVWMSESPSYEAMSASLTTFFSFCHSG